MSIISTSSSVKNRLLSVVWVGFGCVWDGVGVDFDDIPAFMRRLNSSCKKDCI